MFANKLCTYLKCAYMKKEKVLSCEIFDIFPYEDEVRLSNTDISLHMMLILKAPKIILHIKIT